MGLFKHVLLSLFTGYSFYLIAYKLGIVTPSGLVLLSSIGVMFIVQLVSGHTFVSKIFINVSAAFMWMNILFANKNAVLFPVNSVAYDTIGPLIGIFLFASLTILSLESAHKAKEWKLISWWSIVSVAIAFPAYIPFHHEIGGYTELILFPLFVSITYVLLAERNMPKWIFFFTSLLVFYATSIGMYIGGFWNTVSIPLLYITFVLLCFVLGYLWKGSKLPVPIDLPRSAPLPPNATPSSKRSGYSSAGLTYRGSTASREAYLNNDTYEKKSYDDYEPVTSYFEGDSNETKAYSAPNEGMNYYQKERDLDIEFRGQPDWVREKAVKDRERHLPSYLQSDTFESEDND